MYQMIKQLTNSLWLICSLEKAVTELNFLNILQQLLLSSVIYGFANDFGLVHVVLDFWWAEMDELSHLSFFFSIKFENWPSSALIKALMHVLQNI